MANTLMSLKKKERRKKENNPKGKCLQYNGLRVPNTKKIAPLQLTLFNRVGPSFQIQ